MGKPLRRVGIFRDSLEILSENLIGLLFEVERGLCLFRKRFSFVFRRSVKALIDPVIIVAIDEGRGILCFRLAFDSGWRTARTEAGMDETGAERGAWLTEGEMGCCCKGVTLL